MLKNIIKYQRNYSALSCLEIGGNKQIEDAQRNSLKIQLHSAPRQRIESTYIDPRYKVED